MAPRTKPKTTESNGCAEPVAGLPAPEERKSRALKAIRLLDKWAKDDSGYDEQTWPELRKALNSNRASSRKLFNGKA